FIRPSCASVAYAGMREGEDRPAARDGLVRGGEDAALAPSRGAARHGRAAASPDPGGHGHRHRRPLRHPLPAQARPRRVRRQVNQLYDLLYMMGRDDIAVGVGGEGGISNDGRIYPHVGGYFPIIDQGMSTIGECRYRQSIPQGSGGRLDINANYGVRREILPQGNRSYSPIQQPTTQQVMIDTISAGPTNVFLVGTHTNFALFLMSNPHLKKNVKHIYIMGGGVRSQNPTGCCPKNDTSCVPRQCGDHGNMFTTYTKNPYAEFNIYGDPFGAYQVFHSGIPITLVPLDATNTIPITESFFKAFEEQQSTYEAQYSFQSLKIARDTWFDDQFYTSYFMWDSFMSGVALSIMRNGQKPNGDNDFAEMEVMNITVVTSNEPYGVHDGSNPFFDGHASPKFDLLKGGVHSGHVQTGFNDSFCVLKGSTKGKCQDGYTKEVQGPDSVAVLVAVKAKPNRNVKSPLDREFFYHFLEVLNRPEHTGHFNFTDQFRHYKEIMYKPDLEHQIRGKPVIFDMDMSPGDFLALLCLLKAPMEAIDLRGILVSGNGWANPATVDVIYDVLHMMGRDDIPVGLGKITALGAPDLGCEYVKAIPHGSGGFLDTDTLFGLAWVLPRSPRRYTAENSVKYGAPRDTARPELRQPLAFEVWQHIREELKPTDKITILTNGPLTNIANIILSDPKAESVIEAHFYSRESFGWRKWRSRQCVHCSIK
uniref:Inosine/uridine-preferring nucleoside hydrolase domain-containing protein n=1 Tax=Aegilops tauschii subsp. strangulata TaxID=200361 RepID=A0A452Z3G7_AEGTS